MSHALLSCLLQTHQRRMDISLCWQSHKGFTLIEVIFVVTLLATLITFGLSFYRQRTLTIKITRTASEIQQIIQAGSAFFIDKGVWPVSQSQTGEAFEKAYLPFSRMQKNLWDEDYQYEAISQEGHPEKARVFQVKTQVPTHQIASQIAAKLPNSEIELQGHTYVVKAQASVPGQQGVFIASSLIKEIGFFVATPENHAYQVNFKCSPEMTKHVLISINRVHLEKKGMPMMSSVGVLGARGNKYVDDAGCHEEGCRFEIYIDDYGVINPKETRWPPHSTVEVQYMAYCQKK